MPHLAPPFPVLGVVGLDIDTCIIVTGAGGGGGGGECFPSLDFFFRARVRGTVCSEWFWSPSSILTGDFNFVL